MVSKQRIIAQCNFELKEASEFRCYPGWVLLLLSLMAGTVYYHTTVYNATGQIELRSQLLGYSQAWSQ